jgi:hypothetical protein
MVPHSGQSRIGHSTLTQVVTVALSNYCPCLPTMKDKRLNLNLNRCPTSLARILTQPRYPVQMESIKLPLLDSADNYFHLGYLLIQPPPFFAMDLHHISGTFSEPNNCFRMGLHHGS